jgi:N-carbamoyl-L-amino-acid hydrolase
LSEELAVDCPRLQADIETLSSIGRAADGGLYRMAFSAGDRAARDWFCGRIEAAGLTVYTDPAGNIHGRLNWNDGAPSVMTGSHLDTVPGAGALDGALGVMCGLEALRVLKESRVPLRSPLEVVAFSDEEGRFGGMIGSQAMCGRLTPETIHNARDLNGVSLTDAMAECGLNAMDALRAQRPAGSIRAFLELHIEQGPVLDRQGLSIGVVDAITGLFKWNVSLTGVANHAGTTPMDMRRDAFQGLVEIAGEIPRLLEEHGTVRSRATIGRVELVPGAANVVPGRAEFSLEVRDTDAEVLAELADAFRRALSAIARRRELMFEFDVLSELTPVKCDDLVINAVSQSIEAAGLEGMRMPSGAAHDTQIMAGMVPAGMIFVPSKEGRSHSPAEWTAWEDIFTGARVLVNSLRRLSA